MGKCESVFLVCWFISSSNNLRYVGTYLVNFRVRELLKLKSRVKREQRELILIGIKIRKGKNTAVSKIFKIIHKL